jgi:hypothetical protein
MLLSTRSAGEYKARESASCSTLTWTSTRSLSLGCRCLLTRNKATEVEVLQALPFSAGEVEAALTTDLAIVY